MVDNTHLIIGGAATFILLIIAITISSGIGGGKRGESYTPSGSAQFTVNRPKYVVPDVHPQQRLSQPVREGFMVPIPTQAQTLSSANLFGSTNRPTSNPWMGGLNNEVSLGVSVPGSNSSTLLSGNGAGNAMALNVWRTVI